MIFIMSLLPLLRSLRARKHQWKDGAILFRRGDQVREMHLVIAGAVNLVRSQIDGATLILHKAGPGSFLAEASLYSEAYHCDAIVTVEAETMVYSRSSLKKLLHEMPEASEMWARQLAHELQSARLRAEILSLKTVAQRLDAWILSGEWPVPKGQWKLVANQLGVTPEAFYRELAARRADDDC